MMLDSDKDYRDGSSMKNNGNHPPSESAWKTPGGTAQIILNVILVVLASLNIYWITSLRTGIEESAQLQKDQQTLITRRLDSSD